MIFPVSRIDTILAFLVFISVSLFGRFAISLIFRILSPKFLQECCLVLRVVPLIVFFLVHLGLPYKVGLEEEYGLLQPSQANYACVEFGTEMA